MSRSIKVELRNYAVEIALQDFPSVIATKYLIEHEELDKQKETWMSPDNATPWSCQNNAGYSNGILFDSNLDIVVKNDDDEQIDHFKGSDCFQQTFVDHTYSSVPIKLYRDQVISPRVTAMEITEEGFCSSTFELDSKFHTYSREKILFTLRQTLYIHAYDAGKYIQAEAFVVEPAWIRYRIRDSNSIMHSESEFSKKGLVQQHVFSHSHSLGKPNKNKSINKKACDSLFKHFISKKKFT